MFENMIAQEAADRIAADLAGGRLAPSMLFWGPAASGKGTAALELARVLGCEAKGAWNCGCPACERHRLLSNTDLLMTGNRPFQAEIAAGLKALEASNGAKAAAIFFIRAVRKLTARFSPELCEDDPKITKLNGVLLSLEEALDEVTGLLDDCTALSAKFSGGKFGESIKKDAEKLEHEGLSAYIPIAQIRRAAYWSRIAPQGKCKFLLIENADRMQEGSRNSLLKILEEPPAHLSIVLTSSRREAILPTLLSRLRPYRFMKRDAAAEAEVLRRVFRCADGAADVSAYLDSFTPGAGDTLYPLAAFFAASTARGAAVKVRRAGRELSPALITLGKEASARCGELDISAENRVIVKTVSDGAGGFDNPAAFSRFAAALLTVVGECLRKTAAPAWADLWRRETGEADSQVRVWNMQASLVLDRLCTRLKEAMAAL